MLSELAAADYPAVRALATGLAQHLSIQAVIDGSVAGRIWADTVAAPQVAFVLTPEGQYLVGAPADPAITRALAALLLGRPALHLICDPAAWEPALAALLACTSARLYPRHYYTLQRFVLPHWREQLPSGYALVPVTAQLLARSDLGCLDEVRERTGA